MDRQALDALDTRIADALGRDRARLRARLAGLRRAGRTGRASDSGLRAVTEAIDASVALRRARVDAVPRIAWDGSLPIHAHREEILAAWERHPVLVVCGETGSGKTTQLPQLCLQIGRGVDGTIGHTQPRRLAARSVAARIAEEVGCALGDAVGYQVRFQDRTRDKTLVKLMTDGILLTEIQQDPLLSRYDTLIIDEAHERSLNIDFLLGYLAALLPRRPDLRVIVTSATIDPERFSHHFDDAPIIEVSGRTFPVEIRYAPPESDRVGDVDWPRAIEGALRTCFREGPGDALVFLAGEREIRAAARHLRGALPDVEILPLFARLPAARQQAIFRPGRGRRVVLSTNVAETSLTVPGIRYVVDTGRARVSRYSNRRKIQRLPVEGISQAAAAQRAGRCGRMEDGLCIRLFAEREFLRRPAFTAPEIQRTHLAGVILRMKALGLGDVEAFPFVDPPRFGLIRDGYQQLYELGAVDAEGELTERGRRLAPWPLDPQLGRVLVEAEALGCVRDALVVVAALSIQDPRERPAEARDDADAVHARWRRGASDILTLRVLWDAWQEARQAHGSAALRRWCRSHHLSHARLREWSDLHHQLRRVAKDSGLALEDRKAPAEALHRCVLAGFLSGVAHRAKGHAYAGTRQSTFWIWPGSTAVDARHRWIVAVERVETSRLFGRVVLPIDPRWIEPLAGHLVRRHYTDPHWHPERGHVVATERVTLHGLEIVAHRKTDYGPVHPPHARSIFLRQALVRGRFRSRAPFWRHNEALRQRFEDLARRARQTDLLADPEDRFAFYDARVPAEVVDRTSFHRWLKAATAAAPRLLHMEPSDLLVDPQRLPPERLYPATLRVGSVDLPLRYRFEPGDPADGISLRLPFEALDGLDPSPLDWLVPGYLPQKVEALLRTLPKAQRRDLIPLAETARAIAADLVPGPGSVHGAVAAALSARGHAAVAGTSMDPAALPDALRMNVQIVDRQGRVVDQDRDLGALRRRLLAARRDPGARHAEEAHPLRQTGLRTWPETDLPERTTASVQGQILDRWPALVDRGDHVDVALLPSARRAARAHVRGVARLIALGQSGALDALWRRVADAGHLAMLHGTLGGDRALEPDVRLRVAWRAAALDRIEAPRTRAAFRSLLRDIPSALEGAFREVVPLVRAILERYHGVARKLMLDAPPAYAPAIQDMTAQVGLLLEPDWVVNTPWTWMTRVPRYLDAIDARLRRLGQGGLARDLQLLGQIEPHLKRLHGHAARVRAEGREVPEVEHLRWMLEEWRVSLFAQDLGTAEKVSAARMTALWDQARFA